MSTFSGESQCHQTIGAIAQWAAWHAADLLTWLPLHRIPSPATLYRVVHLVSLAQLEAAIAQPGEAVTAADPMHGTVQTTQGAVLHGEACDGKTLRGAEAHSTTMPLVSRVRHGSGVTLGQRRAAGGDEAGTLPHLLRGCDLQGVVLTMDARLTQVPIARRILRQGGDYLMVVKRNQGRLWEAIDLVFRQPPWPPVGDHYRLYSKQSKGHGRLESRTLESSAALCGYLTGREPSRCCSGRCASYI